MKLGPSFSGRPETISSGGIITPLSGRVVGLPDNWFWGDSTCPVCAFLGTYLVRLPTSGLLDRLVELRPNAKRADDRVRAGLSASSSRQARIY